MVPVRIHAQSVIQGRLYFRFAVDPIGNLIPRAAMPVHLAYGTSIKESSRTPAPFSRRRVAITTLITAVPPAGVTVSAGVQREARPLFLLPPRTQCRDLRVTQVRARLSEVHERVSSSNWLLFADGRFGRPRHSTPHSARTLAQGPQTNRAYLRSQIAATRKGAGSCYADRHFGLESCSYIHHFQDNAEEASGESRRTERGSYEY